MSNETTSAGLLGDWQRLLKPLTANMSELAHLEAMTARFDTLVTRAVDVTTQQATRRAEKQAASKELKELRIEGERLATLLRQAVKQHYGIRAEKLAEFGLQPFRGRKAKEETKRVPTKPTPEPTEPPTSAV